MPKPVGSKIKTYFYPRRKAFGAVLCSFLNAKIPSSSDITATSAASMLMSLAAARRTVTSSSSAASNSHFLLLSLLKEHFRLERDKMDVPN